MVVLRVLCTIYLIVQFGFPVDSSKILGIFPAPSSSHYTIGKVLFKELARRGHEVTVISPFEENNPPPNSSYRNIKLEYKLSEEDKKVNFFSKSMTNPYSTTIFLNSIGGKMLNTTLNHPEVKKLLKSAERFDAVIMDQFVNEGLSYFAHHFGANHILLFTIPASSMVNSLVGNPAPPSAVAEGLLEYSTNMNFCERVHNTLFYVFSELNRHLFAYPGQNKILKENIPNVRPLYDYLYNVSLVLVNGHESFADPVALVPVMKNVGGYHVSASGKLPNDLKKFMDDAKEGVIYFSMGSNLKSKDMLSETRDAILRVFAKLKVKILWKWEDDVLPGQPSNVKLGKWLPQQEILAHPNLKLFITHGGLLSTVEAVYHGVPLLTMPVYGDQKLNAATAALKGYAINIPYHEFDEIKFETALHDLLTNTNYKKNAVLRSQLFHDRPMKPMDEAIYWVEYVIRHRGAQHLRVAALKLAWYQYILLDVAAFLLTAVGLTLYILRLVLKKLCCRRKNVKSTKSGKKDKIKAN